MKAQHDMTTRFPIFRKERARSADAHGQIHETGDTIYSKRVSIATHIDVSVEAEGRATMLRFWTNPGMVSPCLSDDYSLGRGQWQCSEDEFNLVLGKA